MLALSRALMCCGASAEAAIVVAGAVEAASTGLLPSRNRFAGVSRPAGNQCPSQGLVLPGPTSLFPNALPGRFGEEAKLRLRSTGRQPGSHIVPSDPFAKSNNFDPPGPLSRSVQGRNSPRRGMSNFCDQKI